MEERSNSNIYLTTQLKQTRLKKESYLIREDNTIYTLLKQTWLKKNTI